jgi:hypothetical protein
VRRQILWRALDVALAAAALAALYFGFKDYQAVAVNKPYDAIIDWGGARAIARGIDPYSVEGLKLWGGSMAVGQGHPPTTLVWFLPLAPLELMQMKAAWNALTVLLLALHCVIVLRELRAPRIALLAPLSLGLVLTAWWMRDHFSVVQLSEQIAFLYLLAWYFLRRGREVAAGAMLGLACTLKLYPGVAVLFLALTRRWRGLAAAAVAWAAIAVPVTARLGIGAWQKFLEQARPYTVYWMTHVRNASIQGIVQRLHFPICQFRPSHREPWLPGTHIATAISLALIALVWWLTRRAARRAESVDLPFAAFTLLSMITGPYAWEHYAVTLLLPFALCAAALWRARSAGLPRGFLVAGGLSLAAVAGMLSQNIFIKNQLWDAWHGPARPSHLLLHFYEVSSWLPAPLLTVLCVALVAWSERRAPGALDRLTVEPAPPIRSAPGAAAPG